MQEDFDQVDYENDEDEHQATSTSQEDDQGASVSEETGGAGDDDREDAVSLGDDEEAMPRDDPSHALTAERAPLAPPALHIDVHVSDAGRHSSTGADTSQTFASTSPYSSYSSIPDSPHSLRHPLPSKPDFIQDTPEVTNGAGAVGRGRKPSRFGPPRHRDGSQFSHNVVHGRADQDLSDAEERHSDDAQTGNRLRDETTSPDASPDRLSWDDRHWRPEQMPGRSSSVPPSGG